MRAKPGYIISPWLGVDGGVDEVRDEEDDGSEEQPAHQQDDDGVHLTAHHLVHHADHVVHLLGNIRASHGEVCKTQKRGWRSHLE